MAVPKHTTLQQDLQHLRTLAHLLIAALDTGEFQTAAYELLCDVRAFNKKHLAIPPATHRRLKQ